MKSRVVRKTERQLDNSIAETARQLVELVKQLVGRTSFNDVNRIVVSQTLVGVVFVDESDWAITEWRKQRGT